MLFQHASTQAKTAHKMPGQSWTGRQTPPQPKRRGMATQQNEIDSLTSICLQHLQQDLTFQSAAECAAVTFISWTLHTPCKHLANTFHVARNVRTRKNVKNWKTITPFSPLHPTEVPLPADVPRPTHMLWLQHLRKSSGGAAGRWIDGCMKTIYRCILQKNNPCTCTACVNEYIYLRMGGLWVRGLFLYGQRPRTTFVKLADSFDFLTRESVFLQSMSIYNAHNYTYIFIYNSTMCHNVTRRL